MRGEEPVDSGAAVVEDAAQRPADQQRMGELPERSQGQGVGDAVDDPGAALGGHELVGVVPERIRSPELNIDEPGGGVAGGDQGGPQGGAQTQKSLPACRSDSAGRDLGVSFIVAQRIA